MHTRTSVEKHTRAAAEIVTTVERQIVDGTLAPGQRVDEVALAKAFGVSRTPVREALAELAAVGLVEQRAHRGAFVVDVTLEEIFDAYELLAVLEGLCARLAARRIDAKERQQLLALHEQMGQMFAPGDRNEYIELDYKFHRVLIGAARNAALRDHISLCMKRIAPIRKMSMEMVRNMEVPYAEHGALLKAVLNGDADEADRIMSEHVTLRAEQVKDLIARWKTRQTSTS